jgi:hypothetical protein
MNTVDAMILLNKGNKVRRITWRNGDYIRIDINGCIVDKNGTICPIEIRKLNDKWEVVED